MHPGLPSAQEQQEKSQGSSWGAWPLKPWELGGTKGGSELKAPLPKAEHFGKEGTQKHK